MLMFGMQVYDGLLYPGIENQLSLAYSSLHLSNFLSFHTLKNDLFVKDYSTTMQARILIFGMQVDDDWLYHGLRTSLLLLILPCVCPIFFPSILFRMKFFIKDFSTSMQARMLIFGMQVDDDLLYHWI